VGSDPWLAPALLTLRGDLTAGVAVTALIVPKNLGHVGIIELVRCDPDLVSKGGPTHAALAGSMGLALALRSVL
jgi:hypothetical protein